MDRFKSILAVMTEDSLHEVALSRAIALAKDCGAALTLVDAIGTEPGEIGRMLARVSGARSQQIEDEVIGYHRDRIAAMAETARAEGVEVSEAVLQGVPFVEITRMVLREGHDLVLKGATAVRGGAGALRGGDLHLLRKCPCPVLILADAQAGRLRRVLAAVDPGTESDTARAGLDTRVLELAAGLAARDGAELHVVHAWSLEGETALRGGRRPSAALDIDALLCAARDDAEARMARSLAAAGLDPAPGCRHVEKGAAGETVAQVAADTGADLLVLGTIGRTGLSGFVMGNTAETILTSVRASVLAVKPDGFESPVRLEN